MQKPAALAPIAKQPVALTGGGFDAVIIAADDAAAPPGGFDPLWSPMPRNTLLAPLVPESHRRTIGGESRGFDCCWWGDEEQGTVGRTRNAELRTRNE